jgi:acyl-[acyl carrier protein]--UDP-N-acetylglucosamine O-acyltransferase
VTLGAGVRLVSHVVVEGATTIGEGCTVHPFANLGGAPQHLGTRASDTRTGDRRAQHHPRARHHAHRHGLGAAG